MSCDIGHRCDSHPTLLWLLGRLAATALIQPIAWEFPYTSGVALKKKKKVHTGYIPLLGIYSKKTETLTGKVTSTSVFIAALFTIAKT